MGRGPNPIQWCPHEKTAIWRHRDTKGEWHAKMEAETGVIQRQAKECQRVLANTRKFFPKLERGKEGLSSGFRGSVVQPALWFQTSRRQNYETICFCCFKPPSLLEQPWETNVHTLRKCLFLSPHSHWALQVIRSLTKQRLLGRTVLFLDNRNCRNTTPQPSHCRQSARSLSGTKTHMPTSAEVNRRFFLFLCATF